MIIRRFDVLSVAKISGIIAAALGLIFAVLLLLFGGMMATVAQTEGGDGLPFASMGVLALVAMPVMYGIVGFIGGAIQALIYNLAAGFVGGVRVETQ